MNAPRQTVLLAGLVLASALATFSIHRAARESFIAFDEFNARQTRALSRLKRESKPTGHMTSPEFQELLRLRGQIPLLRERAREIEKLRTLLTSDKWEPLRHAATDDDFDPQTALAYWPKEKLTNAGLADERSATQTALWALTQKNPDALAACLTPGALEEILSAGPLSVFRPEPEASAAEKLAYYAERATETLDLNSSFYLVGGNIQTNLPGVNAAWHIYPVRFEGEKVTRALVLEKVGQQWRVNGIYPILGTLKEPRIQSRVWP